MSGAEFLRQLRALDNIKHIPVIIISADATTTQVERLQGLGALAYLTKPIDVTQFLNTLDEVLKIKEAQHDLGKSTK